MLFLLEKRFSGIKAALPELIKDYEVNAKRLSVERQSSAEQIDYAALGYFPDAEGFLFGFSGLSLMLDWKT